MPDLRVTALRGLPEVAPTSNLADLLATATRVQIALTPEAILVVAQKVVSKAEGRLVALGDVTPGARARALAADVGKDPRLVELILSEAKSVIRVRTGLIIVEHRCGQILANAGIDSSNIPQSSGSENVLLWPRDPDDSARQIAKSLGLALGQHTPVIISDSIGRAWRRGTVGHAIGAHGLVPVYNQAGRPDRFNRPLQVTETATADAIASCAVLIQGEADEGCPAVWVQGYRYVSSETSTAADILRPAAQDLFR